MMSADIDRADEDRRRMNVSNRTWKGIGLALALILGVGLATRYWVVPAIIRGQLQARYGGLVQFRGWWLGRSSAGVKNLALGEGPGRGATIWARAARVETDLSIGKLLRGRFLPDRITLEKPEITFRISADGKPLTHPPLKGGEKVAEVPDVLVRNGRITLSQDGRPAMTVGPVDAELATAPEGGEAFRGETTDPVWGRWTASGRFDPGFKTGEIRLRSVGAVAVDPNKTARIPFVPRDVWNHVEPTGPVAISLDMTTGPQSRVVTTCEFRGASLHLETLGLEAEGATGTMVVDGGRVRLAGLSGRAIGGTVSARGSLDFEQKPPKLDLTLDLAGVDVARTPKSWHLAEGGLTGKLTGQVHLLVALTADGADLSGSSGEATVEGATIGGVPVKSLKIAMKAEGDALRYETDDEAETEAGTTGALGVGSLVPWLVAIQAPPAQDPPKAEKPARGGFVLPKSLSTQVEFEDVDLRDVLARVQALGIPLPFTISGRLSLKAKAKIPLGSLRDVKAYAFHGEATLRAASIAHVDLGEIRARVDLEDGVLDLTEFRGVLVDAPEGDAAHPPRPTEPVAREGPLPIGGFRGRLHAELSPPGRLEAHFEGNALPVGELTAPVLPHPTPLSGGLSFAVDAGADVRKMTDLAAWTFSGRTDAASLRYRDTTLDRVGCSFALKEGRLILPDIQAILARQPLAANLALEVRPPYAFDGALSVTGWDLDAALGFIPAFPRPSPLGGRMSAATRAGGTLSPLDWRIDGAGRVQAFRAGPLVLGDLPVAWTTEGDTLRVRIRDDRPTGGTIAAEALIPVRGDRAITGTATIKKLDVASAAGLIGGAPAMSGRVDGRGTFRVRPNPGPGEAAVEGDLTVSAPDLTVQGLPTRNLQAVLEAKGGGLRCDFYAEGLGGKMQLVGTVPLEAGPAPTEVEASLKAVGFRIEGLLKALGVGGAAAGLEGVGAIDANIRTRLTEPELRVRGVAEAREVTWGDGFPLGSMRGVVTLSPEGWRVDELTGDVLGGTARGSVVAARPRAGPSRMEFNLDVDRA